MEYHGPHCSYGCDTLIAEGLMALYPECVRLDRLPEIPHWFTKNAVEASKEIGDEMKEKSLAYLEQAIV